MKIATLNTWKNDGEYEKRVNLIIEQTRLLAVDLLFIQENFCTKDETIHTAKEIADGLGYTFIANHARLKHRSLNGKTYASYSGLAVIYKPSLNVLCHYEQLPTNSMDGGRGVQFCAVSFKGISVCVVNAHFTHLQDTELKKKQFEYVLKHKTLKDFSNSVILGDFNITPEHAIFEAIREKGFVAAVEEQPTFPASKSPQRTLDYIFTKTPDLIVKEQHVCYDTSKNGVYPSDHFGLSITLVIPKEDESH